MNQTKINQQIEELKEILLIEKKEDFEQFRQEVAQLSLSEKRKKGLTWQPLEVKKEGYTFGERAFVIVERTSQLNEPNRFKAGAPVEFFSLATDKFSKSESQKQSGVIQFLEKNRMKIILNSKDLPDWLGNGQLGVDLLFDERTYLEMERVLNSLLETKNGRLAELKAIFYNELFPSSRQLPTVHNPYLNDSQVEAVQHILAANDVAVVHGPPGTGKTTTLVYAIKQLCETEKNVLVTAPSNAAVDLLAERLMEKGLNVVRIGNISRVDEKLVGLTIESRLSAHPESKHIKKVKIQAAKLRRNARRFKRKFGSKEREERRDAYREARDLDDWAIHLEDRLIAEILFSADVIACTLINAVHPVLEKVKFRTVVIDEAAQALEPASWIPISRASRVVLAGDPFQLPPTVKSNEARRRGFGTTLLEKYVKQYAEVSFLNTQYRMNQTIMGFSNAQFYENQLIASKEVADWQLSISENASILFIDTAGCGFTEEINAETLSRFNKGEFFILREHFLKLVEDLTNQQQAPPSMGIISPYRAQIQHIEAEFKAEEQLNQYMPYVDIDTIDAFQGQERDLIIISLVRSNEKTEIGFLSDYRRMNVAMTRARKQLIVIGDSATIGSDEFYGAFLEYVEKEGKYVSAWEYMSS